MLDMTFNMYTLEKSRQRILFIFILNLFMPFLELPVTSIATVLKGAKRSLCIYFWETYGKEKLSSKVHLLMTLSFRLHHISVIENMQLEILLTHHYTTTSSFLHSFFSSSLKYTLTHTTHIRMFHNAWWPIYYWRGTPTDKQIPRNEVIWPGHVYTNTAEGFYG